MFILSQGRNVYLVGDPDQGAMLHPAPVKTSPKKSAGEDRRIDLMFLRSLWIRYHKSALRPDPITFTFAEAKYDNKKGRGYESQYSVYITGLSTARWTTADYWELTPGSPNLMNSNHSIVLDEAIYTVLRGIRFLLNPICLFFHYISFTFIQRVKFRNERFHVGTN